MSNYSKILNTMRMVSTQTLSDMKELTGMVLMLQPFRSCLTNKIRRSLLSEEKKIESLSNINK